MLNDSGIILSQTEFLPFGETWTQEGDKEHAPKYNSQELDKESGYYFYNARHYDPEICRFVTGDNVIDDQYNTQGWNRYSYVKNNPIIYKDPTGNFGLDSIWDTAKDIGKGVVDRASEYGDAVVDAAGKVKKEALDAIKDPKAYANKLDDKVSKKVSDKIDDVANNPKKVLKDTAKVCGETLLDTYKEMSGAGRISRIAEADNPANQLGREVTDAGVAYAGAKGAELAGKLLGKTSKAVKGAENAAEEGVIYKRIDPKTGESYIGQSKSPSRFDARQLEHDRKLGVKHDYEKLGSAKPGKDLDFLEEKMIREHGGIQKEGGSLANKRHQMSEKRYQDYLNSK